MPLVFQIILPAWKHASQQRLWEPVFWIPCCFDRQLFGPDAKASLTIQETKELVLAVKNIAAALSNW
jgi:hypothetical protein